METASKAKRPGSLKATHGAFLLANLVYLFVVHAFALTLGPGGAPYDVTPQGAVPLPAAQALELLTDNFGDFYSAYYLANLLVFYGVLVLAYMLVNGVVRGPIWLGSFGMALLMANPIKSEALLLLTGMHDLLPAFLAILSVAAFMGALTLRYWTIWFTFALLTCLMVTPFFPGYGGIVFAYPLLVYVMQPPQAVRGWLMALPLVLIGGGFALTELSPLRWSMAEAHQFFTPLFLLIYPIGLLPETAARLEESPLLFLLAVSIGCLMTGGLGYKLRSRAYWTGILIASGFRLCSLGHAVDPVTGAGGGILIVPLLGMSISLAALAQAMLQHPKWVRPTVGLTTALCLLFFVLQWQTIQTWRDVSGRALPVVEQDR